jgi:Flp pilus assembly protein CpaB
MKARIVAGIALMIGSSLALVGWLGYLFGPRISDAPEPETVLVLVAKQKIPWGVQVTVPEHFFREESFLKGQEPARAITRFEELENRCLNKTIGAGVPVTPDDLLSLDKPPSWHLPEGMRAVTIPFDLSNEAGGFALPGCRVDVLAVTRQGEQSSVHRLAENLLILAHDMNEYRDENGRVMSRSLLTLQATNEEADLLEMAANCCRLRWILRPQDDHERRREPRRDSVRQR